MEENNKLIAEFMGYQVVDKPKIINGENFFQYLDEENKKYTYCKSLLRYNYSWDWLKIVVDEIEIRCEGVPQQLLHLSLFSHQNEVYNAVVEFIKLYNQNK